MKTWKLLSVPLMLMLLSGMPWSNVSAENDTNEQVTVQSGENLSVGNVNITKETPAASQESNNAVKVEAAGETDASLTVNGDVTLDTVGNAIATNVKGLHAKASAKIIGNVTVTSDRAIDDAYYTSAIGVLAESDCTEGTVGEAEVNIDGKVSATHADGEALGINVENAKVTIGEDVNVTSSNYYAGGVSVCGWGKSNVDIKGGISAKGVYANGICLSSEENLDENGVNYSGVKLNIGKDITVTASKDTLPDDNYIRSSGNGFCTYNSHGDLEATIKGSIIAKKDAPRDIVSDDMLGINIDEIAYEEVVGPRVYKNSNKRYVIVDKDIISDGVGVCFALDEKNSRGTDVLVKNIINGKYVGVQLRKQNTTNPKIKSNLTVWKIELNKQGNVAELRCGNLREPIISARNVQPSEKSVMPKLMNQTKAFHGLTADINDSSNEDPLHVAERDFEKKIMYIIKVDQPSEGGKIKAVDENGNDLKKSFGFDVAHEGEKVLLKANLKEGYKITKAYNGLGEKTPILKDKNGNYYIIVPKGGGVYLTVELEYTTQNYYAGSDDDSELSLHNLKAPGNVNPETSYLHYSEKSSGIPKTGDNRQILPWLALSIVSVGSLATSKIFNKKNSFKKSQ